MSEVATCVSLKFDGLQAQCADATAAPFPDLVVASDPTPCRDLYVEGELNVIGCRLLPLSVSVKFGRLSETRVVAPNGVFIVKYVLQFARDDRLFVFATEDSLQDVNRMMAGGGKMLAADMGTE